MQRSTTITRTIQPILILVLVAVLGSLGPNSVRAMPDITVRGNVWADTNCDGIRKAEEPVVPNFTVYLFAAGEDQLINTSDDQVIEQWTTGTAGIFRFSYGITDLDYALAVLPRDRLAGFFPGPLNAGDDRAADNDLRADLWVTNGFRMDENQTVTGIDIGLCQMALPLRLYLPAIVR